MYQKKLIFYILIFIFYFGFTGIAMAQLSTSTQENIDNLKDSLTEDAKDFAKEKAGSATQTIGNEVSEATQGIMRKIPGKVLETLKIVSKKVLDIIKGGLNDDMRQWFDKRKNAVIKGIEEERQEFGGDAKEILPLIWKKIKDVFKSD